MVDDYISIEGIGPRRGDRAPVWLAGSRVALDHGLARHYELRSADLRYASELDDLGEFQRRDLKPSAGPPWTHGDRGVIAGWLWEFLVRHKPQAGYDVEFAGGLHLLVNADGSRLTFEPRLESDSPDAASLVFGPALILALALRGTFALHASAASFRGRAAVFMGDSGAGKSTLAAGIAHRAENGWHRIADDVLPVVLGAQGSPFALPEYPQLKLAPEECYTVDGTRPEQVPIAALYILDARSEAEASEVDARWEVDESRRSLSSIVGCELLSGSEALSSLIAHTIAGRLFAPDLAARHLEFCASVAASVPVKRLTYPRRMDALDSVAAALAADMGADLTAARRSH